MSRQRLTAGLTAGLTGTLILGLGAVAAIAAPSPARDGDPLDRDWDIQHLHLALDVQPEAHRIEGSVTLTVSPLLPGGDQLMLHQRALDITSVTVGGVEAAFELGDETVSVTMPGSARAAGAEPLDVTLTYSAEPRKGLHFRVPGRGSASTHLEVWSQGEHEDSRFWFPTWDYPSDRFTTSGRFTAPEGLKVLSNGVGGFDGEAWSYRMEQDMVSYLVMIAVGAYEIREDAWGDVPIAQWYPPDADAEQAESVSGHVPDMMAWFSEITGLDYPYPSYTEVFVQDFMYTGMENTTATVQDRKLLHPAEWRESQTYAERVAAHELAHQWFGDALTCERWSELWLNEGFATYFAATWMAEHHGEDWMADAIVGWHRSARGAGVMSSRWWSTPDGKHGEHTAVYVKGAAVLQMLRATYGEAAFWDAIRRYTTENAHSLVNTDDLREAFEAATGQHLGWFFDQWTHLPGSPTLSVTPTWEDGKLRVAVSQEHDPEGAKPLFRLPIDLAIGTADGVVEERFWLDAAEAEFSLPLAAAPTYVAVDPKAAVLGTLTVDQPRAWWRAQVASTSTYARLRAMEALGEGRADAETVALLSAVLMDPDEALAVREGAAGALGSLADGEAALLTALADPHPKIRWAAADALGQVKGEAAARALARAARRDPVPWIAGRAMEALGEADPALARTVARELLRPRPDYWGSPHRGAVSVLGQRGTLDDLGAVLRHVTPETPRRLRHEAAAAAVLLVHREAGELAEFEYARVARALEPMLESADVRTRERGVALLTEVGDEDTLALLDALESTETIAALAGKIAPAKTAIRQRDFEGKASSERAALAERLEALETRLEALETDEDSENRE